MSIASFRQSPMVWLTSGWSGTSRSPTMFSSAGDLIGKHRADQVLRLHARELRRHALAAANARQRQRNACDPAPANREHRRVEQGLDENGSRTRGMQIAGRLDQFETVRGRQRQHDVVLGRGGLQFEIELATETLAQRKAPGPVEAAAIGRMDDELHAAGFVEEALEHDRVLGRQAAERRVRSARYSASCSAAGRATPRVAFEPINDPLDVGAARSRAATSARSRETESDNSSLRPGASPSQKGIVGAMPCASSTRTRPRSTRRMR